LDMTDTHFTRGWGI